MIGVVSWGPALCGVSSKKYGVYARVTEFKEWINSAKGAIDRYCNSRH